MILQATLGHEFVHKKPMFIFATISNQFHQMRVSQLPKKDHLSLKRVLNMLSKLAYNDDMMMIMIMIIQLSWSESNSGKQKRWKKNTETWTERRHIISVSVIKTHQPFTVALCTLQIQELDGDRLGLQTGPGLVIKEALVNRPKPSLSEEITGREVPGDQPELCQGEDVEVGPYERKRQVLWREQRGRIAEVREGQPTVEGGLFGDPHPLLSMTPPRRRSRRSQATGKETSPCPWDDLAEHCHKGQGLVENIIDNRWWMNEWRWWSDDLWRAEEGTAAAATFCCRISFWDLHFK